DQSPILEQFPSHRGQLAVEQHPFLCASSGGCLRCTGCRNHGAALPIGKTAMSWRGLLAGLASLCMVSSMANAAITQQEWAEYSARFVSAEGRVVDDGNG